MAISNYTELQTAIGDWLDRTQQTDFMAFVPTFVTLAEAMLNSERRLRVREAEEETTMTPASNICTLPTDYAMFREVWADTSPVSDMTLTTPEIARRRFDAATTGYPVNFTIVGTELRPYPGTTADIGMIYYKTIPALSVSAPTNWALTAFPHVYLNASLVQAATFIKDPDGLTVFSTALNAFLDMIKQNDDSARFANVKSQVKGHTP